MFDRDGMSYHDEEDPNAGMHCLCPGCHEWFIRMPFANWYPYCSMCAIRLGVPSAPVLKPYVICMPNPPPWWRRILERFSR